jgi:hypothetical protein
MTMTAGLLVADTHTRSAPVANDGDSPTTIAPLDLDANPEIEQFLATLGLGSFDRSALTAPFGRNDVWAGPTSSGTGAFVKRLRGGSEDVAARMRRSADFETLLAARPPLSLLVPRLLGHDVERGLVAHELVAGAVSGAQHMVDETFGDALARRVGEAVAAVHEMVVPDGVALDVSRPPLPSLDLGAGRSYVRAVLDGVRAAPVAEDVAEEIARLVTAPPGPDEIAAVRRYCSAQASSLADSPSVEADVLCRAVSTGTAPADVALLPERLALATDDDVVAACASLFADGPLSALLVGGDDSSAAGLAAVLDQPKR